MSASSGEKKLKTLTTGACRRQLLHSGTALTALAGVGFFLLPMSIDQARAACTIDVVGSPDTVACGSDSPAGANYDPVSGDNVIVNIGLGPAGGFTVGDGIRVDQNNTVNNVFTVNFNVNSSNSNQATITSDGVAANTVNAITILAADGEVTFKSDTGSTITTTGSGQDGVNIAVDDAIVNVTSNSVITVLDDGIQITADDSPQIAIVQNALITAGGDGVDDGIYITGDNSKVDVTLGNDGGVSGATGGDGISITTNQGAGGEVKVTVDGQIGSSGNAVGDDGVFIDENEDAAVNVTVGTTGDIYATSEAIRIDSGDDAGGSGDDNGTATVDVAGSLTSTDNDAIDVRATDGAVNVTTRDGGVIAAALNGINVEGDDSNTKIQVGDTITATGDGVNVSVDNATVDVALLAPDPSAGSADVGLKGGAISADKSGIRIQSSNDTTAAGGSANVRVTADAAIGTAADPVGENGINISESDEGSVDVKVGTAGSIHANLDAIFIDAGDGGGKDSDGTVKVDVAGKLVSTNGDAIDVDANDGRLEITTRDGAEITANGNNNTHGIEASSDEGDITVTVGDTINTESDGINAATRTGNVEITLLAPDANQGDIFLDDADRGALGGEISAGDNDGDAGIFVNNSFGNTKITANAKITANDGIMVEADGGNTVVDANEDIVADDIGISVDYEGDDNTNGEKVDITTAAGKTITSGGDGIFVDGDDSDVNVTANGDIDSSGDEFAAGPGDGIDVRTDNGNIKIETGGKITADEDGIRANSSDDSTTDTDGNVTIVAKSDIKAGNSAIRVEDGEVVDVTVETGATVMGAGTDDDAVVELRGDGSLSLTNRGTIKSLSLGADLADPADDLADQADDVAVDFADDDGITSGTLNNDGTIIGQFDGSDSDDTFNNNSPNSWIFTGTSDFESGEDTLNNTSADATTSGFILNAVLAGSSETAQYVSLEQFNNAGKVSLSDQLAGETFFRDRAYTDGSYDGQDGNIHVDADLGQNPDSDRFIVGGDVTGRTLVEVNNIATGPGVYSKVGIPVIEVQGNSSAGEFSLANGPISAGFVTYDLYFTVDMAPYANGNDPGKLSLANSDLEGDDPAINSMWVLAASANSQAFELPVLMSAAQEAWHTSTGVWLDRMTDLREDVINGTGAVAQLGNATVVPTADIVEAPRQDGGLWTRVFGSDSDRDIKNSNTIYNSTSVLDQSYDQQTLGFMIGADFGTEVGASGTFLFGLLGGYMVSDVDFDDTNSSGDLSSGMAGAYVTYLNGGWFVDGVLKVDFGTMDYDARSGDLSDSSDIGVLSIGGQVDAGYRFNIAEGAFFEPGASLAYVHTSFDDDDMFGTDINFEDGESLRGRIGARLGFSMNTDGLKIEPFVQGSWWNEFGDDNGVTLSTLGGTFGVTDDNLGSFGQVGVGVNVFSVGEWSAFARVDGSFGDDYRSYAGNAGFRYDF